jgi:hypothetical protein
MMQVTARAEGRGREGFVTSEVPEPAPALLPILGVTTLS